MNIYALFLIVIIAMVVEIIPLSKKKLNREIIVLLMLGVITLAYGYYYNTHMYTASLINLMLKLFNMK